MMLNRRNLMTALFPYTILGVVEIRTRHVVFRVKGSLMLWSPYLLHEAKLHLPASFSIIIIGDASLNCEVQPWIHRFKGHVSF